MKHKSPFDPDGSVLRRKKKTVKAAPEGENTISFCNVQQDLVSTPKTEVKTVLQNEIASCGSDIDAVNVLKQNKLKWFRKTADMELMLLSCTIGEIKHHLSSHLITFILLQILKGSQINKAK